MATSNFDVNDLEVFYVGGKYIKDDRGTHMTGQVCIRRYGTKVDNRPAVIFIHGAAQTGTHWETTPDGRPGLALLQAQAGWECYVVDQPGVGRSRYHAEDLGPLAHYTAEEIQECFTAPPHDSFPQAKMHTQWPGSGKMGSPIFDHFYASQVGHRAKYSQVEGSFRPLAKDLFARIGPAFLVTHSQSGPIGWHLADECPEMVKGIIALEPNGPPFVYPGLPTFYIRTQLVKAGTFVRPFGITSTPLTYEPPLPSGTQKLDFISGSNEIGPDGHFDGACLNQPGLQLPKLAQIPIVIITGEASYHATYDHLTVQFLRDAGVSVEHICLADRGIRGNGHLMAIEKNNVEIWHLMNEWLEHKSVESEYPVRDQVHGVQ
jgi:pimeloyl-ACP methyl ester carboxylesterase